MGEIAGSMIAAYVIAKIIEWLIIRRVINNYTVMVILSGASVLVLFVLANRYQASQQVPYTSYLFAQIIACLLLPPARMFWKALRRPKLDANL